MSDARTHTKCVRIARKKVQKNHHNVQFAPNPRGVLRPISHIKNWVGVDWRSSYCREMVSYSNASFFCISLQKLGKSFCVAEAISKKKTSIEAFSRPP